MFDFILKQIMYLVKSNILFRLAYPNRYWKIDTKGRKELFLTFDDGPHPEITPFVLDLLRKYNAKATFFCLGNNVKKYPETYETILKRDHAVGNHTHNHLKGWKTSAEEYMQDIEEAGKYINTKLFRPPHGRMTKEQERLFFEKFPKHKIIMWSVLSGDFDNNISAEKCLKNVIKNTSPGSIIVFHDSEKAFGRLKYALPRVLEHCTEKGFTFKRL